MKAYHRFGMKVMKGVSRMLCQNCQKRVANVHFTQIINNKKTELYLCDQCAREKGQFNMGASFSINDFLTGLIGFDSAASYIESQAAKQFACEKCGMNYEEFQRTGRIGCNNCYEVYADKLRPLIKRLHGSTTHNGKMPHRVSDSVKVTREIEKLKELLNRAVQDEQYEKAAEIRDRIRGLELNNKKV